MSVTSTWTALSRFVIDSLREASVIWSAILEDLRGIVVEERDSEMLSWTRSKVFQSQAVSVVFVDYEGHCPQI